MVGLKNNWKLTIYYYARLMLWVAFYYFIALIILGLVSGISSLVFSLDVAGKILESVQTNSPIYYCLSIFAFLIMIAFYKLALNRVFFKEYNKIELIPSFKKVTWKFSAAFVIKIIIAATVVSFLLDFIFASICIKDLNPFQFALNSAIPLKQDFSSSSSIYSKFPIGYLVYGFIGFLLQTVSEFIITNLTINKHATISQKLNPR